MAEVLQDTTTTVELANSSFRAVVANGGLESLPDYLYQEDLASSHIFIITDSNVRAHYGDALTATLDEAGLQNSMLVMPAGEKHKTFEQAGEFIKQLAEMNANRGDPVIALGGGVVGDLAGFVASIYNRGVPLVQVPTTLLAMVDSSIGGKTGVDHGGKNKTGTFYQPRLIVADPNVLQTIEDRVYTEGFGEIVKYAMLDSQFFPQLEEQAGRLRRFSADNLSLLGAIVARSVKQKSDVIADDPHERKTDGRILLNYGHTLGHGFEAAGNYTELLHGEGVAIGMTYAAQLAVRLELAQQSLVDRQTALLEELGLPISYSGKASLKDILRHVAKDKKNTESSTTRFVLPRDIGQMVVKQVGNEIVQASVSEFLG